MIADEQRKQIDRLRTYRGDRMRLAKDQRILDPKGGPLIAICGALASLPAGPMALPCGRLRAYSSDAR